MLDSIYHMTKKLIKNHIFCVKTSRFCNIFRNLIMDIISCCNKICKPGVVYQYYCMELYHSQMRRHVMNIINLQLNNLSKY